MARLAFGCFTMCRFKTVDRSNPTFGKTDIYWYNPNGMVTVTA